MTPLSRWAAGIPAESGICPKQGVTYEPMFVFNRIKARAADGLDLAIEFSTLGEYGFLPQDPATEYPQQTGRAAVRTRLTSVAPTDRRPRRPACSTTNPPQAARRTNEGRLHTQATGLAAVPRIQVIGALRTPRVQTDWAA